MLTSTRVQKPVILASDQLTYDQTSPSVFWFSFVTSTQYYKCWLWVGLISFNSVEYQSVPTQPPIDKLYKYSVIVFLCKNCVNGSGVFCGGFGVLFFSSQLDSGLVTNALVQWNFLVLWIFTVNSKRYCEYENKQLFEANRTSCKVVFNSPKQFLLDNVRQSNVKGDPCKRPKRLH